MSRCWSATERLGQKLNITGKGRCNVTNDTGSPGACSANIPRNGKFLYSAFTALRRSGDTMAFFERLGVPLKVERGNRVFPVSDRAFDISAALERRLKALHVRWAHDRAVDIETAGRRRPGRPGGRGDLSRRRRDPGHRRASAIPPPAPPGTATVWRRPWATR